MADTFYISRLCAPAPLPFLFPFAISSIFLALFNQHSQIASSSPKKEASGSVGFKAGMWTEGKGFYVLINLDCIPATKERMRKEVKDPECHVRVIYQQLRWVLHNDACSPLRCLGAGFLIKQSLGQSFPPVVPLWIKTPNLLWSSKVILDPGRWLWLISSAEGKLRCLLHSPVLMWKHSILDYSF